MRRKLAMVVVLGGAVLAASLATARRAQEHEHAAPTEGTAIALSPDLSALLSTEMLAVQDGLGLLMAAMTAGDWPRVAEIAKKIETSYILDQRLTAEQAAELGRVLPPRFKTLDAAFHGSAGKLAKAAEARDAELAVFHSYKLMEACIECHAAYAGRRFPGFVEPQAGHEHH